MIKNMGDFILGLPDISNKKSISIIFKQKNKL